MPRECAPITGITTRIVLDFCLRLLDAGLHVAYLPHARVVQAPDPSGRSLSRHLRYAIRNDCLGALFNEPWPLPIVSVPVRLTRYLGMRRHEQADDPGGFTWVAGQVLRALSQLGRERRSVSWRSLRASPRSLVPGDAERVLTAACADGGLAGAAGLVHVEPE